MAFLPPSLFSKRDQKELTARPFHQRTVTLFEPRLNQIYYALYDGAISYWNQCSRLADDNRGARGKEFSRPREAIAVQTARRKGATCQCNRRRISVGIAGDLTEYPVHTTCMRQHDGRAQLGRRKIRKWETNEND